MTPALIVRPEAETDLAQAARWYQQQAPGLGRRFLDELDATFARIASRPGAYPVIRGILRRALLHRFPYGVFYAFEAGTIVVVAVMHAGRDPELLSARSVSEP